MLVPVPSRSPPLYRDTCSRINAHETRAITALKNSDEELKLLRVVDAQRAADRLEREAAALEKAHAPRFFFSRGCNVVVLAREDGLRAVELAGGWNTGDHVFGDAFRFQVLANPGNAVLARHPVRAHFGIALVGELLLLLELVQQKKKRLGRFGVRRKLAGQFGAGMLAPGKVPERPRLELRGRVR